MARSLELSQNPIPPRDRLIVALDVPGAEEARRWVEHLGEWITFYKIGLELFMAGGYLELLDWLVQEKKKKVLADLKFFDVPATVRAAMLRLREHRPTFVTVHGNDAILKAAVEAAGKEVGVLAVTVLTSLDQGDLNDLGFTCKVDELVLSRARRALALGCRGVISSGLEVPRLRKELGGSLVVVTPGVRPVENREIPGDDQRRVVDVRQAFLNGADYIVVGRPIRKAPDPLAQIRAIHKIIESLFGNLS